MPDHFLLLLLHRRDLRPHQIRLSLPSPFSIVFIVALGHFPPRSFLAQPVEEGQFAGAAAGGLAMASPGKGELGRWLNSPCNKDLPLLMLEKWNASPPRSLSYSLKRRLKRRRPILIQSTILNLDNEDTSTNEAILTMKMSSITKFLQEVFEISS